MYMTTNKSLLVLFNIALKNEYFILSRAKQKRKSFAKERMYNETNLITKVKKVVNGKIQVAIRV